MSWARWEGGSLSNTGMSTSVFRFDLKTLPVDFVECLMRFLPTENEVKVLRLYERERKPLENLSDEDRFMMQFSKIERLMQKMTIMAFIGNFAESIQMLTPVSGPALARAWRGAKRENFLLFSFMVLAELHFMSWTLRCFPRTFEMAFLFSPFFSHCVCQVNLKTVNFPIPCGCSPQRMPFPVSANVLWILNDTSIQRTRKIIFSNLIPSSKYQSSGWG